MNYLMRLLDSADPSASLRHACYLLVVLAGCAWLTYGVRHLDANWAAAFAALLGAVTVGKVAGKKAPAPADTNGGTIG